MCRCMGIGDTHPVAKEHADECSVERVLALNIHVEAVVSEGFGALEHQLREDFGLGDDKKPSEQ
jgi:hypothetical protein